ncbi:hypothetical protein LCGC14_1182300 [marine sediment metagenome]|uniref:Uncharacterized protein n=1 Tax=marine sediment metagenome TaxID=412755 RepID=A0A0F9M9G2_9ZZZZ
MFQVGDEVRVRSNGAVGVVGYAEPGYFCVDLDNGVEMDFFDEGLLQRMSEYKAERSASVAVNAKTRDLCGIFNAAYSPRKGDKRLAGKVIKSLGQIMPDLLKTAEKNIEGFAKMEAFDQVKNFSEMVGTPMVVFMGAAEMGDINMMRLVIQKTLIANAIEGTGLLFDVMVSSLQDKLVEKD